MAIESGLEQTLKTLFKLSYEMYVEPERARERLKELEDIMAMLQYLTTERKGTSREVESRSNTHVECFFEGCTITSAVPDACLLNFAPEGTDVAQWFCRTHHPTRTDGIVRPGWQPPVAERQTLARERKRVLTMLTPADRKLINGNMV